MKTLPMNTDKPHRCPACHAVAIPDGNAKRLLTGASVTCCRCGTRFTRWPWLVLRHRGVVCHSH